MRNCFVGENDSHDRYRKDFDGLGRKIGIGPGQEVRRAAFTSRRNLVVPNLS